MHQLNFKYFLFILTVTASCEFAVKSRYLVLNVISSFQQYDGPPDSNLHLQTTRNHHEISKTRHRHTKATEMIPKIKTLFSWGAQKARHLCTTSTRRTPRVSYPPSYNRHQLNQKPNPTVKKSSSQSTSQLKLQLLITITEALIQTQSHITMH